MASSKLFRRYFTPVRDFSLGLVVFFAVGFPGLAGVPGCAEMIAGAAHARRFDVEAAASDSGGLPLDQVISAAGVGAGQIGFQQILTVAALGMAFATLVATNLWFARHLRRVHAADRRRGHPSR